MKDREAFLANRRLGIGGSDIAAILCLSPWSTPYDVYLSKIGEGDDEVGNPEAVYWGTVLEDVVAKEYATRTGRKVQRVNQALTHPKLPIARCNIDRAVVNPEIAGNVRWKDGRLTTDRILEVKTANQFKAKEWDEADGKAPDYYVTQGVWNAEICGVAVCDMPVLIGGQRYQCPTIEHHPDLAADMLEEAERFWRRHVSLRIPPDPSTVDEAKRKWAQHLNAKTEIVDAQAWSAVQDLHEIAAAIKDLEKRKDAAQLVVMKQMEDAEAATHAGETLCTWKTQTANRFDQKGFAAAHPDVADLFTKESSTRVFRLKSKKG